MQITFLVGNGFDLAAGLKTSYPDFYKWYCNKPSSTDQEDSDCIKEFKRYILDNKNTTWADCELGLAQYTNQFTISTANQYIDCYNDLHTNMVEFISLAEKEYSDKYITDQAMKTFRDGIKNFYQEVRPCDRQIFKSLIIPVKSESVVFSFISFNYTNLLDRYIKNSNIKYGVFSRWSRSGSNYSMCIDDNILHIHGTKDYHPILGVSDESDVANKDLLQISEINCDLLKQSSNASMGDLRYEDAINRIDESTAICIFGMSLGKSDSYWWETLVDWLSKDNSRHLIIFWYSPEHKADSPVGINDTLVKNIQNKLLNYSDISTEQKSLIQNRIHVVINATKMLRIPEIS